MQTFLGYFRISRNSAVKQLQPHRRAVQLAVVQCQGLGSGQHLRQVLLKQPREAPHPTWVQRSHLKGGTSEKQVWLWEDGNTT